MFFAQFAERAKATRRVSSVHARLRAVLNAAQGVLLCCLLLLYCCCFAAVLIPFYAVLYCFLVLFYAAEGRLLNGAQGNEGLMTKLLKREHYKAIVGWQNLWCPFTRRYYDTDLKLVEVGGIDEFCIQNDGFCI